MTSNTSTHRDGDLPHIELTSRDAKNTRATTIPLRRDVAACVGEYLETLTNPSLDTPLFNKPPVFPKKDARGCVLDIHALQTTFCTHLAVAGVHPRLAQQAMHHSRLELTTQYYTAPALLDIAEAVNPLPVFGDHSI